MRKRLIRCGLVSICGLAVFLIAGSAASRSEKVTLCHVPPGNPANAHTIVVGEPAVKHHLWNHAGDSLGPCPVRCDPTVGCDDENACTVDVCNADGTCDSSQALTCDDGDVCTFDVCDIATGCLALPDPACDDGPCCDPDREPGVGGNPICFEGHSCCGDGTWRCNTEAGSDTCDGPLGLVCECDPDAPPGDPNFCDGGPVECDRDAPPGNSNACPESICDDGIDNDGDELIDALDPDCQGGGGCPPDSDARDPCHDLDPV